jgi:SAM-dependent methyltransferase
MTNWVTQNYVIPFIGIENYADLKVCEVGCGEAGVLKAFLDKGCNGTGIELVDARAALASANLKSEIELGRASVINKNIYDIDTSDQQFKYDLIVLKDVIEHIPNQEIFIPKLKELLRPGGKVFFGYPPWWMPFGGHQQIGKNKFLSKLPWIHLLPRFLYRGILNIFGEPKYVIDELMDIKSTGITIDRMHSILKANDFKIIKETHWLLNPIYLRKFSFKPLKSFINIPYLRNFYVTAHYILFEPK